MLDHDILNELTTLSFEKSTWKTRTHLVRERNSKVIQEAKHLLKSTHNGKLFCEVCRLDFSDKYGKLGDGLI